MMNLKLEMRKHTVNTTVSILLVSSKPLFFGLVEIHPVLARFNESKNESMHACTIRNIVDR